MVKKAWREPYTQGLDGLCAVYSVLNSTQILFPGALTVERAEEMFDVLVRSLGPRLAIAVTDGLGVPSLRHLLIVADEFAQKHLNGRILRREPFKKAKFGDVSAYLSALELEMQGCVAIVGLGKPEHHWTVFRGFTPKSVLLADSIEMRRLARSKLALDGADDDTIAIDQHQTFIISRAAKLS